MQKGQITVWANSNVIMDVNQNMNIGEIRKGDGSCSEDNMDWELTSTFCDSTLTAMSCTRDSESINSTIA